MKSDNELNQIDKIERPDATFLQQLDASFRTTVYCQWARVLLNRGVFHTSPLATLKDLPKYWHSGLVWNTLRGGTVFGSQAWIKDQVYAHVGKDSHEGKIGGVLAAGLAGGTAACFFETPFIRATLRTPQTAHLPLMRFSVPSFVLYCIREILFNAAILGKKDYPQYNYELFCASVYITSVCHKFISCDTTSDIQAAKNEITPDLKRDGFLQTVKNIANGGAMYNNPAFHGRFKNPANLLQKLFNLVFVTSHYNVLIWRSNYVLLFGALYYYNLETIRSQPSFWSKLIFLVLKPKQRNHLP